MSYKVLPLLAKPKYVQLAILKTSIFELIYNVRSRSLEIFLYFCDYILLGPNFCRLGVQKLDVVVDYLDDLGKNSHLYRFL
jgi:hypothetical protein